MPGIATKLHLFHHPGVRLRCLAASALLFACGGQTSDAEFRREATLGCEQAATLSCFPQGTVDQCVAIKEADRERAQGKGCGDVYDTWVKCVRALGTRCNG